VEAPPLPSRRPSLVRSAAALRAELAAMHLAGHADAGGERAALLDEQLRGLLGAPPAAGAGAKQALSGDDSSDGGGDGEDMRFLVDRAQQMRDYRARAARAGGDVSDGTARRLLALGADAAAGTRLAGAFGDDLSAVPASVLEELATPFEFEARTEGAPYPDASTAR
jgi:hypothetical protein